MVVGDGSSSITAAVSPDMGNQPLQHKVMCHTQAKKGEQKPSHVRAHSSRLSRRTEWGHGQATGGQRYTTRTAAEPK